MRHHRSIPPENGARKRRVGQRLSIVLGVLVAILAFPAGALADSIGLSTAGEAVQERAIEISVEAFASSEAVASVYVNPPGIGCSAQPEADPGTAIIAPEPLTDGSIGAFSEAAEYTPPSSGNYVLCGWLTEVGILEPPDSGAVMASTSALLAVRPPHVHLRLSLPRRVRAKHSFVVAVHVSSEVARTIVLDGMSLGGDRCPVAPAVSAVEPLLEESIEGGPHTLHGAVASLPSGRYIFCAWADPPEDGGLYPQASASLIVTVHAARRRVRCQKSHAERRSRRRRACLHRMR